MKIKTTFSVVVRIVLWLIMLVGGALFSLSKDWNSLIFHSIWFHLFSFAIGIVLITLAFRGAANGGKELSKGRKGDIPRLETNRLVTSGIYSCMRHPMLFGLMLLPLGLAFLLGSPTFISIVAPLEMLFIAVMVLVFEEREVHQKFGKAYEAYKKEIPMVSVKWKCIQKLFAKKKTS